MTGVLLTAREVAARLQVKDKTVYAWASQGKIPCLKVNGVIRFDASEIDQWLKESRVQVGMPLQPSRNPRKGPEQGIDRIIERAKRKSYTRSHGETRPTASLTRKEDRYGAR